MVGLAAAYAYLILTRAWSPLNYKLKARGRPGGLLVHMHDVKLMTEEQLQ